MIVVCHESNYKGVVVTDALKYVNDRMDHLISQEKKLVKDTEQKEMVEEVEEIEQQNTTNGIF